MLESAIARRMSVLARPDFFRQAHFRATPPENQAAFRVACDAFTVKITLEEAEQYRILFHIGLIMAGASKAEVCEFQELCKQVDAETIASTLEEFAGQVRELHSLVTNKEEEENPYILNTRRYLLKTNYPDWINAKFPLKWVDDWVENHLPNSNYALPGISLYLPLEMTQDTVLDQAFWAKHLFAAGSLAWLWELGVSRCKQDQSLWSNNQESCPALENARIEMMVELDPVADPPRHWIIRSRLHLDIAEFTDGGGGYKTPRHGFQTMMPAISMVAAAPTAAK
jgi:hypothetical protein